MEAFIINKNMSVFFSFVPRLYYILPWRLRLVPESSRVEEDEVDSSEEEDLDEDEKR